VYRTCRWNGAQHAELLKEPIIEKFKMANGRHIENRSAFWVSTSGGFRIVSATLVYQKMKIISVRQP